MNRFPLRLYFALVGMIVLLALSLLPWLPSGSASARRTSSNDLLAAAAPVY